MYEYKIVNIERLKTQKTREVSLKKGKVDSEAYIEIEPFEDFCTRTERTLNDLAAEGWQIVNVNYSLPIQGAMTAVGFNPVYASASDFSAAEFIVVLQRTK